MMFTSVGLLSDGAKNGVFGSSSLVPAAAYKGHEVCGVILDHEAFSSAVRRLARYQIDEACAEVADGEPYFEGSRYSGDLAGSYQGKAVYGWKAWMAVDAGAGPKGRQLTGDCTSWGVRGAIDVQRAMRAYQLARAAIKNAGDDEEEALSFGQVTALAQDYYKRQATALIYSGRGFLGEGANPARLSSWACKHPICVEQDYGAIDGERFDFTDYAKYYELGVKYGRSGMPEAFVDKLADQHKNADGMVVGAKSWKMVREPDAVLDLMANGYFCHVGSSFAWENSGDPISRREGSWAHDMVVVGFDARPEVAERFGGPVVFVDQSWGNWNRVTGILPEWQPWGEGMFAISWNDFKLWVSTRGHECCVMTDTVGFSKQEDLPWTSPWWPV